MAIKLIVGLRNPGPNYAGTRHNAGAWFVETLAQNQHLPFKADKKLGGEWVKWDHDTCHCILMLPLAFMNLNGASVRSVAQFYNILPNEILIAHDELDLAVGDVRLKTGGGHGGHNGLRDTIAQIHSNDFHRLRVGIGHPGYKEGVSDYVLSKPSLADKEKIMAGINRAQDQLTLILSGNVALAMNRLHSGG